MMRDYEDLSFTKQDFDRQRKEQTRMNNFIELHDLEGKRMLISTNHITNVCERYMDKQNAVIYFDTAGDMEKELKADLVCLGLRRAEGGVRSSISQCFNSNKGKADRYYPCFWWTDEDKSAFEQVYNITHSDAYTVYGFKRTGCAGCPFNSKFEEELKVLHKYEPKLATAVEHIFAPSYEYTRAYRKFKESRRKKHD